MLKKYNDSSALASMLISSMNAATWVWNIQKGEVSFNARWAEMLGYTLEELQPISIKTWEKLSHPDDYESSSLLLEKVFHREQEFYSIEMRMKHKSGNWVWILDSGKVIEWDEKGAPLIALGTHIDINERKQIEEQSKNNEAFLRQIIENTKDIIYRIDMNGVMTYLSRAWTTLLGHPIEAVLGDSFRPFAHPDDLEKLVHFFEKVKETNHIQDIDYYRLKDRNGNWKVFESSATPIIEQEEVIGYAGIARDITEKKRIEAALIREKDFFEATLMCVGDAVIVTNEQGFIINMNPIAQELTGYSLHEAVGHPLAQIFNVIHQKTKNPHEDIVKLVLSKRKPIELHKLILINKNGESIYIDDSAAPIISQKGVLEGVVIVFRNVSEEIARQEQIEYLSYHDQLTNCYNRHYLDENIEHINCVENYPLGIISIDLNNLKLVNDTMGHQKGDYVIQGAASIIRSSLTRGDYLFRMGGDDFLVFVPNTNTQELESMHNFIIDEVKKRCDENCPLTLSFGYEVLYQYDQDLYHGIKKADNRMYEHKRQCKSTLTK